VLVLGGTAFVGRAIVAALLDAGHSPTIFSRGVTGRDLFPAVPRLTGDRQTGDYTALAGPSWDAVVDVTGFFAWQVEQATAALGDRTGRYLFVSSHAVFAGGSRDLRPALPDAEPPLTDATYGPSKVACEDVVRRRYGDRATIVRPGKVVGPYDRTDSLTYWVRRAARGGRVAVPGSPDQPVQIVDSRAVGALVATLVSGSRPGAYTAVGSSRPFRDLIGLCAAAAGTTPTPVAVPFRRFPLVKAPALWDTQHRDPGPAIAAGMPEIPVTRTIADLRAWDLARGEPPLASGFTAAEEAALLP